MSSLNGNNENNQTNINENELADLLGNAFNDFCKIYEKNPLKTLNNEAGNKAKNEMGNEEEKIMDGQTGSTKMDHINNELNNDDNKNNNNNNGHKQLKSDFMSLYESDPVLKEHWSNFAKSTNQTADNIDLDESLMETLKNFYDKAKNITELDGNISETELNHILKQLNNAEMNPELKDGLFEMNKIMPLMSNIMENLLSKDFLYPTLAELNLKYPVYLKENKDTVSSDDYIRYEKQHKIINKLCEEFENETENDDKTIKSNRFNKILTLMQEMQSFGTPPAALVSNNPDIFNELNSLKRDTSQCIIM